MSREIKFRGLCTDDEGFIDVLGFEGFYKVNVAGDVKSVDRYVNHKDGGMCFKKGRVLKPSKNRKGYLMVALVINGVGGLKSIHRIVAENFIENHENKPQVNHKNGVKTDNRVENLEWSTGFENQRHAFDLGLNKGSMLNRKGEEHPRTLISDKEAVDCSLLRDKGFTIKQISEKYNVSYKTIQRVLKREIIGNIHEK